MLSSLNFNHQSVVLLNWIPFLFFHIQLNQESTVP